MDEEIDILSFIRETLGDFVFSLEDLMSEIQHAPPSVSQFLGQTGGNIKQLSLYLLKYGDHFFLENGKVAVFDPDLEAVREKAVRYFEEKLNLFGSPCNYMDFRTCVSQAEVDVQDFVRCFYPGDTFKQFLSGRPHVFVLFEDDTVFLIENETVDYFEQCVEERGEGLHYTKLLDFAGRAPKHVVKFVNEFYPAESFLKLLENNCDVFRIEDGCVYLSDDEL